MAYVARYIVSPNAAQDTESILRYLTREASGDLALAVEDKLFSTYEKLASVHVLGHRRSDLTDREEFRFYLLNPYLIVFQRVPDMVIIHAVLHGARDVRRTLRARGVN